MSDYQWLNDLLNNFVQIEPKQKNIFDLAGYPHYENVISNLYAFYLDPTEEHNFQHLFINSLVELLGQNNNWGTKDFSEIVVEREWSTIKGGRIDIFIHDNNGNRILDRHSDEENSDNNSSDWAIIIENKINHELVNDLDDYWNSVIIKDKIGIVLSLVPIIPDNKNFVNITHGEFIAKVKSNLPEFFIHANDRHLSILKDFIMNIENQSKNDNRNNLDSNFFAYQSSFEKIKEFEKTKKDIYINLNRIIIDSFKKTYFSHSPQGDNAHSGRHFNGHTHNKYQGFRFWVNIDEFFNSGKLVFNFELFKNTNTKFRDKLVEKIKSCNIFQLSSGGKAGAGYAHIFKTAILFNHDELKSISTSIPIKIKERLFVNTPDNDGIYKLVKKLEDVVSEFEKLNK